MQNIYAKKVTKRPIDDRVRRLRDARYGITNTNGEAWRTQRKNYVQFMKVTGFQKSRVNNLIEDMWPKIKQSLTAQPSTIVQGCPARIGLGCMLYRSCLILA